MGYVAEGYVEEGYVENNCSNYVAEGYVAEGYVVGCEASCTNYVTAGYVAKGYVAGCSEDLIQMISSSELKVTVKVLHSDPIIISQESSMQIIMAKLVKVNFQANSFFKVVVPKFSSPTFNANSVFVANNFNATDPTTLISLIDDLKKCCIAQEKRLDALESAQKEYLIPEDIEPLHKDREVLYV